MKEYTGSHLLYPPALDFDILQYNNFIGLSKIKSYPINTKKLILDNQYKYYLFEYIYVIIFA